MKDRFRIIHISELHAGSLTGITPPQHQTAVNRKWLGPLWEMLASMAKQVGRVDAVIANGDLIDGPGKKDSTKHTTTDLVEQIEYAVEALSLFRTNQKFVVRGTGYHTDQSGSFEDSVAKEWGAPVHDDLRLKVFDVLTHWRHVVGRSDIPYGQYTQDAKEMIAEVLQSELEEYEYADLLGRGHVHYSTGAWRWNTARNRKQEVFTNPGVQLRGPVQSSYVRALRTWMYHTGATVVDIWRSGKWDIDPIVFPIRFYAPQMREYLCVTD